MTTETARLAHGLNWFASVKGTGIVATAGATLPVHTPGLHGCDSIAMCPPGVLSGSMPSRSATTPRMNCCGKNGRSSEKSTNRVGRR